jgi:hypothetical protein
LDNEELLKYCLVLSSQYSVRKCIIELILDIEYRDINLFSLKLGRTIIHSIFTLNMELLPLYSLLKSYLRIITKYSKSSAIGETQEIHSIFHFLISKLKPLCTNPDNKHVILRILRELVEDIHSSTLIPILQTKGS